MELILGLIALYVLGSVGLRLIGTALGCVFTILFGLLVAVVIAGLLSTQGQHMPIP
jgi:hypothetical protein